VFARSPDAPRTLLAVMALALLPATSPAQVLPWEVTVAEVDTGRLRNLSERLSKQNLLYQLHLGDTRKSDLVETTAKIDRILESLEQGSPSYGIPAPWTPELREQVLRVDAAWGPLRTIAVASPYDYLRVTRQFMPAENRLGDPLLIRYFDNLNLDFIAESEKLLDLYDAECRKTGLEVCATAKASGYNAMLIERATKQAVFVVAGIEAKRNREGLKATVAAYEKQRAANSASPFFAAALAPDRGASARGATELLESLRKDWDEMRAEFKTLEAGDEKNFDLHRLLLVQSRLVGKVERFTAALVRYANVTYGS